MQPRSFAFVVENDVFLTMDILPTGLRHQEICDGFMSNPTIIEITDLPQAIQHDWKWDGNNFSPPETSNL